MSELIVICPHCEMPVLIESINCGIFRHGADESMNQLPPHAPREQCEGVKYGCGKPFKIVNGIAESCDYI